MKLFVKILFFFTLASTALADVDLDQEMVKAQSPAAKPSTLETLPVKPPVDLSEGFPGIANQGPLGGCQSYAMAAWLDYIFYFKTGHIIDLSEKYLAYNLLSFMTDEFWDPVKNNYPGNYLGKNYLNAKPALGSGVAALMLASYFKSQVIPDSIYSFGQMGTLEGIVGLDFDIFNKYFAENAGTFSHADYVSALPLAFLSAPPSEFIYKLNDANFTNGTKDSLVLKISQDLSDLVGLTSKNVVTYYNLDFQPYDQVVSPAAVKDLMGYLQTVSQHFGQRSQMLAKTDLLTAIKTSLDRRLAVMIAANVWVGDWLGGVVYKGGGGHAMVIVGYQERDGKIYFKLRNSWGKDRLVLGYDYVEAGTLLQNTYYIVVHEI